MTHLTVRKWTPQDLAAIVEHYGPRGETPWDPFSSLARLQGIPLDGLIVAEVNGEYAGFLYWYLGEGPWFDPNVGKFAHILEVHVRPDCQGKRVGPALVSEAVRLLKGSSVEAIYIDTTEDNAAARRLYEGAGFQPLLHTTHYRLPTKSGPERNASASAESG